MKLKSDGTEYTPLELIRTILIREMGLEEDRVNIFNQKFKIPTDDGIFVVIESKGMPRVLSNRMKTIPTASGFTEVQAIATQEMVAVIMLSRSMEAYTRATEALMAIGSLYSQQIQESHGFKIARIAPIENLSGLEGAGMLYRFETSLVIFAWHEKTKAGDFYDKFTVELSTEDETVTVPLT